MSNITTDFIAATKKIHADVRAVLTTLHLIHEDIKIIRDQTVSESDEQTPQQYAGDPDAKQTEEPRAGARSLNVDQTNSKKDESAQETQSYFRDL